MQEEKSKIDFKLFKREEGVNPRQLRSRGFIPVTLYGRVLKESLSLKIEQEVYRQKKLSQFVKPIRAVYEDQEQILLIKSIQRHPVKENEILNIEFHCVELEEQVKALVPIKTKDSSELIKAGGLLFMNKRVALVKCKVKEIPDFLEVSLSLLSGARNLLYFSDLEIPGEQVKLENPLDEVIAKVSTPRTLSSEGAENTAEAEKKTTA